MIITGYLQNCRTPPRWLDVRVIGGVLLLVISVVVGARVIGASSQTSPVWLAAHDLARGTVLTDGDVTVAEVNLGDHAGSYLAASTGLSGRTLAEPIRSGELVPAAALGGSRTGRVVSVTVAPERMVPTVRHGSVIDLYLVTGRKSVAGDDVHTELLQQGVTVQSVHGPASGGLSGATSSDYQVALLLSVGDAKDLVKRLPTGEALVVLHSSQRRHPANG
jgi:hypothetical protein